MIDLKIAKNIRSEIKDLVSIDSDELQDYYDYYTKCLKAFLKEMKITPRFCRVSQIEQCKWQECNDPFVNEGAEDLARRICDEGVLFPVIVSSSDGFRIRVMEGLHRVFALQLVKSDKKIFVYDENNIVRRTLFKELFTINLIWPSCKIKELIAMRSKGMQIRRIKDNYYEIKTKYCSEAFRAILINSMFISEYEYDYHCLKSPKFFNYEEEFKKWYGL